MNSNLILSSDSYKVSHWKQYPPDTEDVYGYLESRGGEFESTVFFGLQYYLENYLSKGISWADIHEAKELMDAHLGPNMFNEDGWNGIMREYDGALPIELRAVKEGSVIPVHNVLMTGHVTDKRFAWLDNYMETMLMQATWYGTTVATLSHECRKIILKYLEETGDPSLIGFKLHCFGCRGSTSPESAAIGSCGHLINFMGTDTIPALVLAKKYYGCDCAGFSIGAAEHSTITSWGKENEAKAYKNMLDQFPEGLVAVVSDSYDIYNAITNIWGKELKEQVMSRNGTLVIRADSGDPCEVVVECLKKMADAFGSAVNEKGYIVLDPHVRLLQGDGINIKTIPVILEAVKRAGFSADNIGFGMGAGLLQQVDRDTCKFAFKASSVTINGVDYPVFKKPATDSSKNSKQGKLSLIYENEQYSTVQTKDLKPDQQDLLEVVFLNGKVMRHQTLEEIRKITYK